MDIVYMLTFVFSFILGTIVGSFLNVVILRYNTGRTILNRSGCFSCGKTLRPQELFPIISFLVSRGRCVSCGSRISLQYPIVELISGLLFTCIAYKFMLAGASIFPLSIVSASLYATAFSIFLTITVYDLRHTIIPNAFVYAFIGISAWCREAGERRTYCVLGRGVSRHRFIALTEPILYNEERDSVCSVSLY